MANYNTFAVINCKKRKIILITSSARKVKSIMQKGIKVEVWNNNCHIETIYFKNIKYLDKYIEQEKHYIKTKQKEAEKRNKRRNKNEYNKSKL